MFFVSALQNKMVLQRNSDNVSEFAFKGKCTGTGTLLLTVRQADKVLANFDNIKIGTVVSGRFTAEISGLPVGGPYDLEITDSGSKSKVCFTDILVGDLWLLGGQSNMADSGFMPSCSETSDRVRAFYMDNRWDTARDPLHDTTRALAPVHGGDPANPPREKGTRRGTGPGLQFGIEMYKHTGIPQGLIACAHGGTKMSQWDPALKKLGGKSLYGALCERLAMNGGKVAGVLWYQGCSDTGTDTETEIYEYKTRRLFAALRRDCKNPQLPIVLAQLGSYISLTGEHNLSANRWLHIRHAQYLIGKTLPHTACVPTIDLELDDRIHLSNRAVKILGKRMAEAMKNLREENYGSAPIAVKRVRFVKDRVMHLTKVCITFDNVVGELTSAGLPNGFSAVDYQGNVAGEAINCQLAGNTATVYLPLTLNIFQDTYFLAYGAAHQPHANITDQANRSLPCFKIQVKRRDKNMSYLLNTALISEAVFGEESLESLQLPATFDNLQFKVYRSGDFFLPCPRESEEKNKDPKIYYYRFKLNVSEDMPLKMLFGADAPFAVYCDGNEIMRRATSNPVVIDEFKCKLSLTAGIHDFCCVLSSNSGKGYGICCRFARLDKGLPPEFVNLTEQ